jgi:hypothetical protein
VAPASGAPQLAQYLPVAAAPHAGQAAVESGEEEGDVMRLKIVRRRLMCSEIRRIWDETATTTYDYRPGAVGRAGSRKLQLTVCPPSQESDWKEHLPVLGQRPVIISD